MPMPMETSRRPRLALGTPSAAGHGFDPSPLRIAAWAFVPTSAMAALYILNGWLRVQLSGVEHPMLETVTRLLALFWTWVPLAPAIWWAARRWPLAWSLQPKRLLLHVALAILAAVAHALLYWGALQLRAALGIAPIMFGVNFPNAEFDLLAQLRQLAVLADTDFIIYGIIVAAATVTRNHGLALASRTRRDRVESRRSSALLEALRRQLRPHFVLNALNTALGELSTRPDRARAVLDDLAALVASTERIDGDLIALDAELALVRAHAAIEQARFSDRLEVGWDLRAPPEQVWVPPFAVQTLFENAIRHGLERSSGRFFIRIELRRQDDAFVIRVRDSGGRIAPGPSSGAQIALANLRSRLALLFDARAQLILRVEDSWTVAELQVPSA